MRGQLTTSNGSFVDRLVDQQRTTILVVLLVTAFLGSFIPHMEMDPTLKAFYVSDCPEYRLYQRFLKYFGNDEFILIAIKNEHIVLEPPVIKSLFKITRKLGELKKVSEVLSLTNIKVFEQREGLFSTYSLIDADKGELGVSQRKQLASYREALPLMKLLVSPDFKTLGVVVKIDKRWRFDPEIRPLLDSVSEVVSHNIPNGSEYRIVGSPVIREAFLRYNKRTAVIFGILGFVIATFAAVYIFKSLRLQVIVGLVVGLCVLWVVGLMSMLGIRINTATSLTFGIIPIFGAATIIHVVTHFNERYQDTRNRAEAAKQALRIVGRPCFMCALTTSVGFASIMVSDIPMVRQVGLILSVGVLLTFVLAMTVTPLLLLHMKPVDHRVYARISQDYVAKALNWIEHFTFSHYKICAIAGVTFMGLMLAGTPRTQISTEPLAQFHETTPEVQAIRFVQKNLSTTRCLEVFLEGEENAFKKPKILKAVSRLEAHLSKMPEVVRTDSLLPFLEHLHMVVSDKDTSKKDLFANPQIIPQLLFLTSSSTYGKRLLSRYFADQFSTMRIPVWIGDSSSSSLEQSIDEIGLVVKELKPQGLKASSVTGVLVVYSAQISDLLRSQTQSLLIALSLITLLMIIQLRSIVLGLLSLVPNFLPITVIFGIMGWFGISLNTMTVFAATASIGLSVDDTIHFLTQLKREMAVGNRSKDVEESLRRAYRITSRALVSTSVILCFGFLTLLMSPFRPVASFGVLLSSGMAAALVGDIVFMPAIILAFPRIRRILNKVIEVETSRNC
jgi:predicted RND superfamily exporter protein